MTSRYCFRCSAEKSREYSSSVKPRRLASGVRSSWLTSETISSFARLTARTLRSSAALRSAAIALCSVTSRATDEAPTITPSELRIGETVNETSITRPSLRMHWVSKCSVRASLTTMAAMISRTSSGF